MKSTRSLAFGAVLLVLVAAAEEGFMDKAADKIKHVVGLETAEEAPKYEAYEKGRGTVKHGEDVMERAKEKIGNIFHHHAKEPADLIMQEAKHQANEQANAVKAHGHGIYDTVKETVTAPFHSAKEKSQEMAESAHERAEAGVGCANEAMKEARRQGMQGYETTKGKTEETIQKGQSKIRQMKDNVENMLQQGKEKVDENIEAVKGVTGEKIEHAKEYAHEVKQKGEEGAAFKNGIKDETMGSGETLVGTATRKMKEVFGGEHVNRKGQNAMDTVEEKSREAMDRAKVRDLTDLEAVLFLISCF